MESKKYLVTIGGSVFDQHLSVDAYNAEDAKTQAELTLKIGYSNCNYIKKIEPQIFNDKLFVKNDRLLSNLKLPNVCPIKVRITDVCFNFNNNYCISSYKDL